MTRPATPPWTVAGIGIFSYTVAVVASVFLGTFDLAAAAAQAIVAEYGCGHVGVVWSDPDAPSPPVRRAITGALFSVAALSVVTLLLASTTTVSFAKGVGPSILGVGLVTAGFHAMRDELFLHGLVLRTMTQVQSATLRVLACGLTSAAAALGDFTTTPTKAAAQALLGFGFGALWIKDRGAWMPWAAHTVFAFGTGTLLQGGLFNVRAAPGLWGGSDAGIPGSLALVVGLLPIGVVALVWARRGISRQP